MLTALSSEDHDLVQTVFKSLVRSTWFDRNDANERGCAKLVLMHYGTSGKTEDELRARCEDQAKAAFGVH